MLVAERGGYTISVGIGHGLLWIALVRTPDGRVVAGSDFRLKADEVRAWAEAWDPATVRSKGGR